MAKKVTTVNKHSDTVMAALAFIILGTILVAEQSLSVIELAVVVFGVVILTLGVLELINKNLVVAICEIVVGIALILVAALAPDVATLVLGIALCLYALYFLFIYWGSLTGGKLTLKKVVIILTILFALVAGILLIVAYAASVSSDVYIAAGAFSLGAGAMIVAKKAIA
ncbi:MAG TPA: hypothetical protein IAC70_06600 [Candidatus Faecicola pullistercoris]|nr:hypothetical protein [Candidatus Faecicola pullistercoris]